MLTATRFIQFIVLSFKFGEKRGIPSESSWNSIGFGFIIYIYSSILSMIFYDNYHVWIEHLLGLGLIRVLDGSAKTIELLGDN